MSATLVLGIIAAYIVALIIISIITSRGAGSSEFFTAGRKSPWWAVAISMVGTSISGVTFISVPGMVRASQFSYLQMALGFIAGYIVIAYVLLPIYYKLGVKSIYSYLDQRLGKSSHFSGSLFFLVSKFLGCGVRMYLTASVLQLLVFGPLGIPFWANAALTMLIVWAYSFRGGVKTLVWTDMFQTLAMIACVVLCIIFVSKEMSLDLRGLAGAIGGSEQSRMFFFDDPLDKRYFWKQFLAGMFTTIAMTGLDQDMMQKNLSCKTLKESQKNVVSYGISFLPVNFLFLCLGILLYQYAAVVGLPSDIRPDDLFPTLSTRYLPAVVGVMFVLGLVSAAFSSAGSAITALTTTISVDFLKNENRRGVVHALNAVVMAGLIIAFQSIGSGSVINAVYNVASYTYGPLLGLFCFGIFTRLNVRDHAVPFVCVASPLICLLLNSHSLEWFGFEFGFELLLVNAALTFVGLLAATSRRRPRSCA